MVDVKRQQAIEEMYAVARRSGCRNVDGHFLATFGRPIKGAPRKNIERFTRCMEDSDEWHKGWWMRTVRYGCLSEYDKAEGRSADGLRL